MNKLFYILLLQLITLACNNEEVAKGTPTCIDQKIEEIAKEDVWNPPAKVYSYFIGGF